MPNGIEYILKYEFIMIKDLEKVKQLFYNFLKDKQQLEENDDTIIDEMLFNIELAEQVKTDMRASDGRLNYQLNVTTKKGGKPYWVKSQSFIAYQSCLKNINTLLISLGLTVRERAKLKMALNNPNDLDKIMGL